jgi:hypothetical protein
VEQPPEREDSAPFSQIESDQNVSLAVNCSCRGKLYEEQPTPQGVAQTVTSRLKRLQMIRRLLMPSRAKCCANGYGNEDAGAVAVYGDGGSAAWF